MYQGGMFLAPCIVRILKGTHCNVTRFHNWFAIDLRLQSWSPQYLTCSPLKSMGDISYPSSVTLGSCAPVIVEIVGRMSRLLASSNVLWPVCKEYFLHNVKSRRKSRQHATLYKNATLNLRDITINSVVRVGNYLDQKETMLCTNNYTLKQIDTLCPFWCK